MDSVNHELGKGQEASVWHAHDQLQKRDIAIKILTTEMTAAQGKQTFELDVMQRISNLPPARAQHLLPHLDSFHFTGDTGGKHLCLVTELLGDDLLRTIETPDGKRPLPLPFVWEISLQILHALEALHDECHVAHTDIKQDNISHSLSGSKNKQITLIDYGSAALLDDTGSFADRPVQPDALRCPEAIVGCTLSAKVDIWNLGCLIFELATSAHLFRPRATEQFTAAQYHMARIYGTLVHTDDQAERLRVLFSKGLRYDKFFREHGGLIISVSSDNRETLEKILAAYGVQSPPLLSLLIAMLQVHPDDRPSAKELCIHPFFAESAAA